MNVGTHVLARPIPALPSAKVVAKATVQAVEAAWAEGERPHGLAVDDVPLGDDLRQSASQIGVEA